MEPTPPFWFKQRQGQMEAAGENIYQVKAPNLESMFVLIRRGEDGWQGALRRHTDGPDVEATVRSYATRPEAWNAAFELFRTYAVV